VEGILNQHIAHPPLSDTVTRSTIQDLRDQILPTMKHRMLQEKLDPLFSEARRSGATAWVGVTDEIALEALRHLHEAGISVPREISVMGFDDTMEAFMAEMTSYQFNTLGAMRPTLDHILRPRVPEAERDRKPVTIEGFVNERQSTGPSPQSTPQRPSGWPPRLASDRR
jgi:DNA-binding LacI/PurR family transcriptional regulator